VTRFALVSAIAALLTLSGCGGGPRTTREMKPGANPSQVAATELAFARAARTDGQWTAFRRYADKEAMIFGRNGAFPAAAWLRAQDDPPEAVRWSPQQVWSSCDGTLAVTRGAFTDPSGATGVFNTVWKRQRGGEYKWVFDFGFETSDTAQGQEAISARVAECGKRSARAYGRTGTEAPPVIEPPADPAMSVEKSDDATLAWGFHMSGAGERRYAVWMREEGEMKTVVSDTVQPSAPAAQPGT
jgi:hypothetical protein